MAIIMVCHICEELARYGEWPALSAEESRWLDSSQLNVIRWAGTCTGWWCMTESIVNGSCHIRRLLCWLSASHGMVLYVYMPYQSQLLIREAGSYCNIVCLLYAVYCMIGSHKLCRFIPKDTACWQANHIWSDLGTCLVLPPMLAITIHIRLVCKFKYSSRRCRFVWHLSIVGDMHVLTRLIVYILGLCVVW